MQNQYIHLKTDNLETIVENEKKVIVMFGSRFCGWCRIILEKYLNSLASQNSDSIFVYIEAEDQMGRWIYPKSMGLLPKEPDQWPWWACFKDGKCIDTISTSAVWDINKWLNSL